MNANLNQNMNANAKANAVKIFEVSHSYLNSETETSVLDHLSLEIKQGEFVAIQGPSGSGKSTLLYLLGCLLKPQEGQVEILGKNISLLSSDELANLRNQKIGFIFQQFHLLAKTNVLNNILLPTLYSKSNEAKSVLERAETFIKILGLEDRLKHLPNQLSGGQQQRVAIARALINDPEIILADEPTGNLDSKTALQTMDLFRQFHRDFGKTLIIITHDNDIAKLCDRVIQIKDGSIVNDLCLSKKLSSEFKKNSLPKSEPVEIKEKSQWPKIAFFLQTLRLIINSFPMAINNLGRNKARTALTMLGVLVGVAALMSMISLGQFTKKKILAGYAELGVNTLVFYGYPNWDKKATDVAPLPFQYFDWERDIIPLRGVFPQIQYMSPMMMSWGAVHFGGSSLEADIRILGINDEAMFISKRKFLYGRNFISTEVEKKNPVCIIGFEIGQRLFKNIFPLGQLIRVTESEKSIFGCRVIGVLSETSSNKEYLKPNLQIFLPFTYFQSNSNSNWSSKIRELIIQVDVNSDIEKTGRGIQAFFNQKYASSGRFRVDSDSVLLAQMKRFLSLFTILLASIGLITLAVGGIGITNMMLVSVSERFREIGIRKAMGATDKSIRIQFLTESIVVCLFAGLLGLLFGFIAFHLAIWSASQFVSKLKFEWTIDGWAFFVSTLSIFSVGILSGLFPAIKAEKLQVVEALRSE